MVDRPTIQHQLSWQKQRSQDHHERLYGQRSLPRILSRFVRSGLLGHERRRELLYLPFRPRNGQLQDSLHRNRAWSQRVFDMEQGQLSAKSARLPLEARAMSLRLEGRHAPLVFRQEANHSHQLGTTKSQQRTPYHETCRSGCLLNPEQYQERRFGLGQLRRLWNNAHSLRTNRSQVLHDGTRPTILRCYTQTLLEAQDWGRGRLGGRDEGTMSKMRLPEWLEALPDSPHKRDEIRRIKNQRRKERLLDYASTN